MFDNHLFKVSAKSGTPATLVRLVALIPALLPWDVIRFTLQGRLLRLPGAVLANNAARSIVLPPRL